MTKFVLSVLITIVYLKLYSTQQFYTYQPIQQFGYAYPQSVQHALTYPQPVQYTQPIQYPQSVQYPHTVQNNPLQNLQSTTVVYGPTRNNNDPLRGQTNSGKDRNSERDQNSRNGLNQNTRNSPEQIPNGQTSNNPDSATKRENVRGQNNNEQNQNTRNQQWNNQNQNGRNTGGLVPIGQATNNQNQNTRNNAGQISNGQTWGDLDSEINSNDNSGLESNDNNEESYAFLGKQDNINNDKPQGATVQFRYNNQYYPNPYNRQRNNPQRRNPQGNNPQRNNPRQNQQNRNNQWSTNSPQQNTNSQGNNIVVTNNPYCTQIAKELIEKGGNVREVFIATSLCEGFVNPMDSGLGGGFQAVYYNFENNSPKSEFIDAREKSPSSDKFTKSSTRMGGNSIAIPTVLAGYEKIFNIDRHKNRLQWSQIIQPVFDLCKNGYFMSKGTKGMIGLLIGSYNRTKVQDNILRIPRYCETLAQISRDGPSSSMYRANGELHKLLVQDLRSVKSTISSKDIRNNKARTSSASVTRFDRKYSVYSTKTPGSGQAMLFALKIIERLRQIIPKTATADDRVVYLLKILKYTYTLQPHLRELSEDKINKIINEASQSLADGIVKGGFKLQNTIPTKFGDVILPKLQSSPTQGTTNIVIKIGRSAITGSSSINSLFGSGIFSETMGFFYNNHLRDFSSPNWRRKGKPLKNAPGPNKVPTSSISPIIMVDDTTGEPVFQIGSAGGSHILSAMINTCFNYFILNRSLQESVAACRIMPKFNYSRNKVSYLYECVKNEETVNRLHSIGVDFKFDKTAGHAAVTALSKLRGGYPEAVFDNRRGGSSYIN